MEDELLSVDDFATKIKEKYPAYKDMDNMTLATKIVEKYPAYEGKVDLKKKDISEPTSVEERMASDTKTGSLEPSKKVVGERYGTFSDTGEKNTWLEEMVGKNTVTDFFGDMWRAGKQGLAQGATVDDSIKLLAQGSKMSEESLDEFIRVSKELQSVGMSDEMKDFNKIYEKEGGGIVGFMKGVVKNPSVLNQLLISSLAAMVNPTVAAGAATGGVLGAGTGAALGSVGGPLAAVTALGGGLSGLAAGASGTLEAGLSVAEFLQDELNKKGLDFDNDGIKTVLEDDEALQRIRNKSAARGLVIGAIDGITAGLASKVGTTVGKAARTAGRTKAAGRAALTATGIEAAGGGVGETAARLATGQELDVAEIGFETVTGTVGAPLSAAKAVAGIDLKRATKEFVKPSKYKVNDSEVSREDVEQFVDTMSDEEIAKTKFEVENNDALKKEIEDRKKKALDTARVLDEVPDNYSSDDKSKLVDLEILREKLSSRTTKTAKDQLKLIDGQIEEINNKYAVQKPSTEKVDVQKPTPDSGEVGKGDTKQVKPTKEVEAKKEPTPTKEKVQDEGVITVKDEEVVSLKPLKKHRTAFEKGELSRADKIGILTYASNKKRKGKKLTPFEQRVVDSDTEMYVDVGIRLEDRDKAALEQEIDDRGKASLEKKKEVKPVEYDIVEGGIPDGYTVEGDIKNIREEDGKTVGTVEISSGNIILDEDVTLVPKKPAPKKEAPKKEAPKKEAPKKEAPKKEVSEEIEAEAETTEGRKGDKTIQVTSRKYVTVEKAKELVSELDKEIAGLQKEIKKFDLAFQNAANDAALELSTQDRRQSQRLINEKLKGFKNEYATSELKKQGIEDPTESQISSFLQGISTKKTQITKKRNKKVEYNEKLRNNEKKSARLKELESTSQERKTLKEKVDKPKTEEQKIYEKAEDEVRRLKMEDSIEKKQYFDSIKGTSMSPISVELAIKEIESKYKGLISEANKKASDAVNELKKVEEAALKKKTPKKKAPKKEAPVVDDALESEKKVIQSEIETYEIAIEEFEQEILNQKSDLKDELAEISKKKLSREEKQELKDDAKNESSSIIEGYKDDIISEKKDLRDAKKRLKKLDEKSKKQKGPKLKGVVNRELLQRQVNNAKKALLNIAPTVNIVIVDDSKTYREIALDNSNGFYDPTDGNIYINANRAIKSTVGHEVFHAILLRNGISDLKARDITKKMVDTLKKSGSLPQGLMNQMEAFGNQYVSSEKDAIADLKTYIKNPTKSQIDKKLDEMRLIDPVFEEQMAELIGALAGSYKQLSRPQKNIVKRFLDRLAKLFGLKKFTDTEVVDLINTISRSVVFGDVITAEDVAILSAKETDKISEVTSKRKQIIGENADLTALNLSKNLSIAKQIERLQEPSIKEELLATYEEEKDRDAFYILNMTPEDVKNMTGWERGKDNKWRYEILDGELTLRESGTFKLSDVYDSKDLYEAYPQLKDMKVEVDIRPQGAVNAWFIPSEKYIEINAKPNSNVTSLLIHEIQHAIQFIEGFATGGNMTSAFEAYEKTVTPEDKRAEIELKEEIEDLRSLTTVLEMATVDFEDMSLDEVLDLDFIKSNWDELGLESVDDAVNVHEYVYDRNPDLINKLKTGEFGSNLDLEESFEQALGIADEKQAEYSDKYSTYGLYQRLAGEVESRNAEKRYLMSEEKRAKTLLEATEDVAREDQILLFPDYYKDEDITPRKQKSSYVDVSMLEDMTRDGMTAEYAERGSRVERFLQKVQDKYIKVRRIGKTIEKRTGKKLESVDDFDKAETLYTGRTKEQVSKLEERFEKIIEKFASKGLTRKDVSDYLYAMHAPERNDYILEEVDGSNIAGSGMYTDINDKNRAVQELIITQEEADSIESAQEVIKRLKDEGKIKDLESIASDIRKIQEETLKRQFDEGLITKETYENLGMTETKLYKHYVPLKGFKDLQSGFSDYLTGEASSTVPIKGKEILKAKGRKTVAGDVLSNIMMDSQTAVIRSNKNGVLIKLLNQLLKNPDDSIYSVYTEKEGAPIGDRKMSLQEMRDKTTRDKSSARYFKFVRVVKDGKEYFIDFKDKDMTRVINLTDGEMIGTTMNKIVDSVSKVTNVMRAAFTTMNPGFIPTNYIRDIQTGLMNALAETDMKIADKKKFIKNVSKNSVKALKTIAQEERGKTKGVDKELVKYYREFKKNGAVAGYSYVQSEADISKGIDALAEGGKKNETIKSIGKFINAVNTASENSTRLAAYIEARKSGMTAEDAAYMAKNLTVNFNRSGEYNKAINTLYMFFNASVQGTVAFTKAMTTLKKEVNDDGTISTSLNYAQKIAIGIVAFSALMQMLNQGLSDEDEDGESFFDKIPEYEKERNLIIMNPANGEDYFKVPLPYGYNFFFNIGRFGYEVSNKKKSIADVSRDLVNSSVSAFSPISFSASEDVTGSFVKTATPTAAKPFMDLALNENFFKGAIYKENFPGQNKPDSSMGKQNTPEIIKEITKFINRATGGSENVKGFIDLSPETIPYIVQQYTGGAGRFLSQAMNFPSKVAGGELKPREIPMFDRLYGRTSRYSDIDTYNERRDQVKSLEEEIKSGDIKRDMKVYRSAVAMSRLSKKVDKKLNELRDKKKKVAKLESRSRQTVLLKKIEEREDQLYDAFNKQYLKLFERYSKDRSPAPKK